MRQSITQLLCGLVQRCYCIGNRREVRFTARLNFTRISGGSADCRDLGHAAFKLIMDELRVKLVKLGGVTFSLDKCFQSQKTNAEVNQERLDIVAFRRLASFRRDLLSFASQAIPPLLHFRALSLINH
jgi:hypothetical protein